MPITGYQLASNGGASVFSHANTHQLFYIQAASAWFIIAQDNTSADWFLWKWDGTTPGTPGDAGGWSKAANSAGGDVNIDSRNSPGIDCFWSESSAELHVLHLHAAERYNLWSYNSGTDDWTNDVVNENIGIDISSKRAGIILDSNGIVWVAWYNDPSLLKTRYRSGGAWSDGADIEAVESDANSSSAVSILIWQSGGVQRVGVAYSYGAPGGDSWKFAWRNDSDNVGAAWNVETIDAVTSIDDHISSTMIINGATSEIFVSGKDGGNDIQLWKRSTAGVWGARTTVSTLGTRPKLVVDTTNSEIYIFYGNTSGISTVSLILYKKTSTATISLGAEVTIFEDTLTSGDFGDIAGIAHSVNSASSLIIAADGDGGSPWWNEIAIAGGAAPIDLIALCSASGSSLGSLLTGINLQSVSSGSGDSIADLGVPAANFEAMVSASGDLSVSLNTQITFEAVASGSGFAIASLQSAIRFVATCSASGDSIADLVNAIRFEAIASGSGEAIAELDGAAQFEAVASGSGFSLAEMQTAIILEAQLTGTGDSTASLTLAIDLAANALGSGDQTADLATQLILEATLTGSGDSSASLVSQINLAAQMLGSGTISADLFTGVVTALILLNDGVASFAITNDADAEFAIKNEGDANFE